MKTKKLSPDSPGGAAGLPVRSSGTLVKITLEVRLPDAAADALIWCKANVPRIQHQFARALNYEEARLLALIAETIRGELAAENAPGGSPRQRRGGKPVPANLAQWVSANRPPVGK